ncbi:inactive peptidyl-prolyl cis-trans isomerase shutdown-like [Drosophila miranda]|uniref:inactive peptidyl-prolyl cis-trans isomerase shutdown-like n=1 Tax=Drosophila miranda TaxID=7229 RepID=UPI00143F6E13|nr:inactive peptidyl-prolyl cis-trans isomerase shutdown-like [Drosophila miranda]
MEDYFSYCTQMLKEPLQLGKLVGSGSKFEVEQSPFGAGDDDFNVDEMEDCDNAPDVDEEELASPWTQSFEELKKLMEPINENIFKRITREGHQGRGLVPDKARVAVRYSGYWEGESSPFDSSLMRRTKLYFETGAGCDVLEGLQAAVLTMRPYEKAEFIISYKLLFHEIGCPPRIKPRSDGLFKIEVLDFTLIGDSDAFASMAAVDRDKFAIVYPKALDMHMHGKDCVKRFRYRNAVTAFERAVTSLNYCRLANDEDERKQIALLITLNQNLMICYNKLHNPKRVCITMKALRRLTENKPSCKALYQEGCALSALGEYKDARCIFMQAQAKQPDNNEISAKITDLDKKIKKYKESSQDIWTRALSGQKFKEVKDETKCNPSVEELVKELETSEKSSVGLLRGAYINSDIVMLSKMAKEHKMNLSVSPIDENDLTLSKLNLH